jgi:hypothetical protein
MTEGQEHEWHIELCHLRAQLSYALDNIDSIRKRDEVEGKIESVLVRLHELCELTKGESK